MKILATILFTFFSLTCFSQEVEVKSEELNRIIWNKINDRLISLGNKPISVYEQGEMKAFSARVCERMIPKNAETSHSCNDSIVKYSGGECIYSFKMTASHENEWIDYIKSGNLEVIAEKVFSSWVGSESHRIAISKDWYDSTTVSTIIRYNENTGYFKIVATWHEADDLIDRIRGKS
tara:strand:- start:5318 stop:5851 length:534 start_codon:yes stop_codon:yes gene_type:complete